MHAVGLAQRIAAERKAFELTQDHQRREALPVRRTFVDFVAAIGGVDRLDPFGALRREILFLVQAAELLEPAEDVAA